MKTLRTGGPQHLTKIIETKSIPGKTYGNSKWSTLQK